MSRADAQDARRSWQVGAVLGAASGPAAGYGAWWSGLGDARPHVWVLAALAGVVLGASTWPIFQDPGRRQVPAPWFTGLFAACVGLLAGAFAGFPLGAVFGAAGGGVGGLAAGVTLRFTDGLPAVGGLLLAALVGVSAGLATGVWMAS